MDCDADLALRVVSLGYVQVTISDTDCRLDEVDDLPVDGSIGAGGFVSIRLEEGSSRAVAKLWGVS